MIVPSLQESLDYLDKTPWVSAIEKEALKKLLFTMNNHSEEIKWSKEKVTKSLEFEEDTFKIDSTGWKQEARSIYGWWKIKVKVNAANDVIEYLEWPHKWEQLFIGYAAFITELCRAKNCSPQEAEQKYLMKIDELEENMQAIRVAWIYHDFYTTEVENHLAGYLHPYRKVLEAIGKSSFIWLFDGYYARFSENGWFCWDRGNKEYGLSGRLLKPSD